MYSSSQLKSSAAGIVAQDAGINAVDIEPAV
jgi:hypothetical protein